MRRFSLGLALGLALAGPAWPEDFAGTAWLEGCSSDAEGAGCSLAIPGGRLSVFDDGQTPPDLLDRLYMLDPGQAIRLQGMLTGEGDGIQRGITLTALEPLADDPLEPMIRALQGAWQPEGDDSAARIEIAGADWRETTASDQVQTYLASFGTRCADGTEMGMTGFYLIPRGHEETGSPRCYGAEILEGKLVLTNQGNGRQTSFARPPEDIFTGDGYFLGCDSEGTPVFCYFQAAGFNLSVSQEDIDPALWAQIEGLAHLAPVRLSGPLRDMSDAAAVLALDDIQPRPADANHALLVALQGIWRPEGGAGPMAQVEIADLDWLQSDASEDLWGASLGMGTACADGTELGGPALILSPYGQDPSQSQCWAILDQTEGRLELEDKTGTLGKLVLIKDPASSAP